MSLPPVFRDHITSAKDGTSLPEERVTLSLPFAHVGIDFLGPLYIKTNSKKLKRPYVCMTTERFLLALTRMMSKKGKIDVIWSDNFKSFKNADKEL